MADGIVDDTQLPSHFISSMSSSQVLMSSLALLNSSLVMWILLATVSQLLSSLGIMASTGDIRVTLASTTHILDKLHCLLK